MMATLNIFFNYKNIIDVDNNKNKIDADQRNEVAPLSAPPFPEDRGAGYF